MHAPCNAKPISLGFTPWNLYPVHNVDTNGHNELEYFNLPTPDGTIPLGFYCSKNVFQKAPPTQC